MSSTTTRRAAHPAFANLRARGSQPARKADQPQAEVSPLLKYRDAAAAVAEAEPRLSACTAAERRSQHAHANDVKFVRASLDPRLAVFKIDADPSIRRRPWISRPWPWPTNRHPNAHRRGRPRNRCWRGG